MKKFGLYVVSDEYIEFLRSENKLQHVFSNKLGNRNHTRKYLGMVFTQDNLDYYIPLSSPKPSDYISNSNGTKVIRKSTIPIIRMTETKANGTIELKGTLKIGDMIPVPRSELTYYDISKEKDKKYQALVYSEYDFISNNISLIEKNAKLLYKQQTRQNEIFNDQNPMPNYVKYALDYKLAEAKCQEFMLLLSKGYSFHVDPVSKKLMTTEPAAPVQTKQQPAVQSSDQQKSDLQYGKTSLDEMKQRKDERANDEKLRETGQQRSGPPKKKNMGIDD